MCPEAVTPSSKSHSARRYYTILVVDDDPVVRQVIRQTLIKEGYKTLKAKSGKEAFEACADYENPIDLMVTDVIMPGMNGRQLVYLLKNMRPRMKCLFMSGHAESEIASRGLLHYEDEFIEKTAVSHQLISKVEAILNQSK